MPIQSAKPSFDEIHLQFCEKYMLFKMRFKKYPELKIFHFGKLRSYGFIRAIMSDKPDDYGVFRPADDPPLYTLTDSYSRYCIYRRDKLFYEVVGPSLTSLIVSIAASTYVVYLYQKAFANGVAGMTIGEFLRSLLQSLF